MTVHVFIGPTLHRLRVGELLPGAVLHAPVVHGDLLRLTLVEDDVVVLVDGGFHHAASVRHKEILALIAQRVRVIGCSSMGALRAAELAPYGMIGHGTVFDMYRSGLIDADDEVAVAHGEAPEYRPVSIPLVNFRHAFSMAVAQGVVDSAAADLMLSMMRSLLYPQRSWSALERLIHGSGPELCRQFECLMAYLTENPRHRDIKAADAESVLTNWDGLAEQARHRAKGWIESTQWRSTYLDSWRARFRGSHVEDVHVADGDVARYQQLYNVDFPRRWRDFVLDLVSESVAGRRIPGGGAGEETSGVEAALRYWGLEPGRVPPSIEKAWLLASEMVELDPTERLLRVLVRSFRHPLRAGRLVSAMTDLVCDATARRAVAESTVVNEQVVQWRGVGGLHRLKRDVLIGHLAETWSAESLDHRVLTAAAQDRGFAGLSEAAETARLFYLRRHLMLIGPTSVTT